MRAFYILSLAAAHCFAQAPAPVISFDKTHHDFGKIPQDQKTSYGYKVTNTGNAPLQIKGIRASCGCSYSVVGQRFLKPGESTFIEVHFDPAGMTGNIHKSLELHSNDPSSPKTLLTFEASVTKEIMPSALNVFFKKVPRDGSMSSDLRLQSGDGQPIVITAAKIPGAPYLSCETQKDGNDVVLNISINGELIPRQKFHGVDVLTVQTASKKIPALQFNIHWDAELLITAAPEYISWIGAPGKELKASVSLSHAGGREFKILEAKPSDSLIKVSGISKDARREHKFDVFFSAKAKAGGYHEKLTLKFDDPEQRELEIVVSAVLR